MSKDPQAPPGGQFLLYQTESGNLKIDVRLEGDTVWLTQQHMAELFQSTNQNTSQHMKKIFEEGELGEISVVKNFFTTAADEERHSSNFHHLDAIISVGCSKTMTPNPDNSPDKVSGFRRHRAQAFYPAT